MESERSGRPFDIIVYGATGYSGELIAEHIVRKKTANVRWAIAGRSLQKLVKLKDNLIRINPDFGSVMVFTCMFPSRTHWAVPRT